MEGKSSYQDEDLAQKKLLCDSETTRERTLVDIDRDG
jgi:hypothetical protein